MRKATTERASKRRGREELAQKQEHLEVKLGPADVMERGEQLARAQGELEELAGRESSTKAALKADRARIEAEIQRLALAVRNRAETRPVSVRVEADYGDGLAYEIREDTLEVVRTRPLSELERQRELPIPG